MRKKIQISLLTLFVLILYASMAIGQTVNMNRWIELTVTQGEWIKLGFIADLDSTNIRVISGSTYDTTLVVGADWKDNSKSFYAESATMRIYGNVKELNCGENGTKLIDIDVSNNTGIIALGCYSNSISSLDVSMLTNLISLYCPNNYLTSLNVSGCISLKEITCSGNNLSACGLDSIYHQLPQRGDNDKGSIYIKQDTNSNIGVFSCRDTIATNRNWKVLDFNNNISINIVNISYSCSYFTLDIEGVKQDNISAKVYPNPAKDAINVETKETIKEIILYDVMGKEVLQTKETKDIDVSNLDNGIYILKLCTEKGTGEYKVIKK